MRKLFLSIVLMLLPLLASADAVEIGGIYYNLDLSTKEAEVTSNPNDFMYYKGDLEIPDEVNFNGIAYSVTSIGDNSFKSDYLLKSITIPNSVKVIGENAFSNSGLTSLIIPNSVINNIFIKLIKGNIFNSTEFHIIQNKSCNFIIINLSLNKSFSFVVKTFTYEASIFFVITTMNPS